MSSPGHPLDLLVVVLWEPQDIVNVAATIRAMKNFGLRRLRLVSPAEWDPWRIEGSAQETDEVIHAPESHDTLEAALDDCSFIVGMTARGRRVKRAVARPRDVAPELLARAAADHPAGSVAILFGREDTGLPNHALDLCHRTVTIPTNPEHKSLNLAQAVLVMAYELWMAHQGTTQAFKPPRHSASPATLQHFERFFADIERALWAIDFFKNRHTEHVMRTVREIAHRADLDQRETNFLRAIAIEVVKFIDRERK